MERVRFGEKVGPRGPVHTATLLEEAERIGAAGHEVGVTSSRRCDSEYVACSARRCSSDILGALRGMGAATSEEANLVDATGEVDGRT